MTTPSFVRIAAVADVAKESSLAVKIDERELLVVHSKGDYFVIVNKCTHADQRLECGRVRNGWVSCPIHGARFDLATGRAMNPPATRPIQTFPTRVVDDWIEAEI